MKLILKSRCQGKRMKSTHYFLNPDHTYTPCDLMTWARQFENEDRKLAFDIINNHGVSTVWIGLNQNYGEGPPLVFETMVFDQNVFSNDTYRDLYSTWDEALAGHQLAIEWVKNGCKEDER